MAPKFEEIPAGAYDPADVPSSEEELIAAVEAAAAEVERIRLARVQVRDETPKGQLLEKLAESDDSFVLAIDRLNAAGSALGRFRGTDQSVRHVAVGVASETEAAGVEPEAAPEPEVITTEVEED